MKTKKDLMSGVCNCSNCKYKREKENRKYKCVDCKKIKTGEIQYDHKHGPLCEECYTNYQGET